MLTLHDDSTHGHSNSYTPLENVTRDRFLPDPEHSAALQSAKSKLPGKLKSAYGNTRWPKPAFSSYAAECMACCCILLTTGGCRAKALSSLGTCTQMEKTVSVENFNSSVVQSVLLSQVDINISPDNSQMQNCKQRPMGVWPTDLSPGRSIPWCVHLDFSTALGPKVQKWYCIISTAGGKIRALGCYG